MALKLTKDHDKIGAVSFGAIFITVVLVISFNAPNPTPFQYTVFRIVLALAASGIAAMIPGLLNVRCGNGIRATGAMAVFVVVYFFSPANLLKDHDDGRKLPQPPSKIVHVAALLNGRAGYVLGICTSLHESMDTILRTNGRELHWEEEVGSPDEDGESESKVAISRLLSRFNGRDPDYFVTIGTAVSQHAKKFLADHKIPHVFVGVTNPVAAGLVKSLGSDPSRGSIAGTTYPPRPSDLVKLLERYFAGQRLGFIYSPKYPQDVSLKNSIESLLPSSRLEVVFIPTDSVNVPDDQIRSVDIFFGKYMLCANINEFAAKYPQLRFIGASASNVFKGAVAAIGPDDAEIGRRAAEEILKRNLLSGEPLASMAIIEPDTRVIVNTETARRLETDVQTLVSDPGVKQWN